MIPWASRYHNEALSLQLRWCLFPLFRVRYYLSTLRISLHACHDGLDKVAHVAHVPGSASVRRSRLRHWTTGFPRSRRLSRPWPRLRTSSRLDRAPHLRHCHWQEGRPAFKFPAVDGYLARLTRRRTAAGGDNSAAWLQLRRRGFNFFRSLCFGSESGFGFCGKTVMVVLPGCPSRRRHEPARSQGIPIPANNFPNELARV